MNQRTQCWFSLAKLAIGAYTFDSTQKPNRDLRSGVTSQLGADALKEAVYQYDDVDQLTSEVVTGGVAGSAYSNTFVFDAMGNRTSATRAQGASTTTTTSTPNALNQLTSLSTSVNSASPQTSALSYDAGGNLTQSTSSSGAQTLYFYDDLDRLTRIENKNASGAYTSKNEFVYDYASRKAVSKEFTWTGSAWNKTGETRRVFDGLDVVQERNDANQVTAQYVRDGNIGGILARTSASGKSYFHYDGGGNVTALSDENGALVGRYAYDAFGNTLEASGARAVENPYRFSTKEHIAGMVDFGYRFYSPNMGRWLNRDPIRENGGVGLYNYVRNNPVNLTDTDGLRPITKEDLSLLHNLPYGGSMTGPTNGAIEAIKAAISAVPNGSADPPNLRAVLWALKQIGDTRYGGAGSLGDVQGLFNPVNQSKCNRFVADAYAVGGGIGYGGYGGFPMRGSSFYGQGITPVSANTLGSTGYVPYFRVTGSPKVGDLASFGSPGGIGHTTLNLGGGLLIYAGGGAVKVGTVSLNQAGHSPVVYREYTRPPW